MNRSLTGEKYLNEFLNELSGVKRASRYTLGSYKTDLIQFLEYISELNKSFPEDFNERTVKNFIYKLSTEKLSKKSIARKLSSLRGFSKFLIRNGIILENPTKLIKNPKREKRLPETIPVDSFANIIKLIDEAEEEYTAWLYKSIFDLLYGCALRVSELCNLEINDIDFGRKVIHIYGKGAKERMVPLGNSTLRTLENYLYVCKNENKKFLSNKFGTKIYPRFVQRVVKKYLDKTTEIKNKYPHTLRHSAATHMMDKGADLLAVKEILGHEDLSTTEIYTHVSIERLKKTYKSAHPKS